MNHAGSQHAGLNTGGVEMGHPLNTRRALLRAVDAFLKATPESLARAHRIVQRCYAARRFTTLDEIVWGGIIMELTDSAFFEDQAYLLERRSLLANGSPQIHRAYLNYDFRPAFSHVEREWHVCLQDMLDLLDSFPFPEPEAAAAEYERRSGKIKHLQAQSPPPSRHGDEMIYHLIMRDVTEVVTTVRMAENLLRIRRLLPDGVYAVFPPRAPDWLAREPDVRESLAWARRALRSIVEEGWLLITWQVTPDHYNLSVH